MSSTDDELVYASWEQAICPYCGTEFERDDPLCTQCPDGELCWCNIDGPDSFSCQLLEGHEGDCRSPYDNEWLAARPHMRRWLGK